MDFIARQKGNHRQRLINYVIPFVVISFLLFLNAVLFPFPSAQAQNIAPTTLPEAIIGTAYSVQLLLVVAPSPPLPHTWSIINGSLPPGLFLSPTGIISGTPLMAGTFTFVVQVTCGPPPPPPQQIFQQGYYIVVKPHPITILTTFLAEATEGKTYSIHISIEGGTPPYTWSIIGGALPNGLTLDTTTGVISGTPTRGTAGSHSFTVKVTDSSFPALSSQRSFTITVKKGFYDVIITIGSGLTEAETKILVDGSEVAKLKGGETKSLSFPIGTRHIVAIEPEILHPTKKGIKFKAEKNTITIDEFSPIAHFNYDIYYQLTVTSPHGKTEGSGWYKANTEAKWSVIPGEIPMSGILGFFKGKIRTDTPAGTEIMDAPKEVTITWKPDYTMPTILIPGVIILLVAISFGIYRLVRPVVPKPAVAPIPPPAPPTVVVMESAREQLLEKFAELLQKYEEEKVPKPIETTRKELVEKFGELLRKYEEEVRGTVVTEELTEAKPRIPGLPEPKEKLPLSCTYTSKNLIRTVVGNWYKKEEKVIPPSSPQESVSLVTVWARDIYNEWEILSCSLPQGHSGEHKFTTSKAYTLQNTVTEEKTYDVKQKPTPPKPHFTDELPAVEVAPHQIIGDPNSAPFSSQ